MNHPFTADGNSPEFTLMPGYHTFAMGGTTVSGTAKLQFKLTDTVFVDVAGVSLNAAGASVHALGGGRYRFNLAGATSPNLTVGITD